MADYPQAAAFEINVQPDNNELYEDEDEDELMQHRSSAVCTEHTKGIQEYIKMKTDDEIAEKCVRVLDFMKSEGLDLSTFLWHVFWNNRAATANRIV